MAKKLRVGPTAVRKRHPRSNRAKPTPWEPCNRDLEIYGRVCSGRSYRSLSDEYHLSLSRLHEIVSRIDGWLAPQLMEKIREIKANHTTRLMHIYQEAMAAWEKSKENAVSVTEKSAADGNELSTTTKGQCGDSSYLSQARAALQEIREIWGADAPLKLEHSGEIRVAGRPIEEVRSDLLERMNRIAGAANQN
ncbi:MAG TPA: hypothetical protein VL475_02390 [Planctomycetaceae bacterium]|nr:hypothetical protein [Planctomycetaceae bacterium]